MQLGKYIRVGLVTCHRIIRLNQPVCLILSLGFILLCFAHDIDIIVGRKLAPLFYIRKKKARV